MCISTLLMQKKNFNLHYFCICEEILAVKYRFWKFLDNDFTIIGIEIAGVPLPIIEEIMRDWLEEIRNRTKNCLSYYIGNII